MGNNIYKPKFLPGEIAYEIIGINDFREFTITKVEVCILSEGRIIFCYFNSSGERLNTLYKTKEKVKKILRDRINNK